MCVCNTFYQHAEVQCSNERLQQRNDEPFVRSYTNQKPETPKSNKIYILRVTNCIIIINRYCANVYILN